MFHGALESVFNVVAQCENRARIRKTLDRSLLIVASIKGQQGNMGLFFQFIFEFGFWCDEILRVKPPLVFMVTLVPSTNMVC